MEFNLNDHETKETLIAAIRNTPYKGGNTATGRALDFVREQMFARFAGVRPGTRKIRFIMLL